MNKDDTPPDMKDWNYMVVATTDVTKKEIPFEHMAEMEAWVQGFTFGRTYGNFVRRIALWNLPRSTPKCLRIIPKEDLGG